MRVLIVTALVGTWSTATAKNVSDFIQPEYYLYSGHHSKTGNVNLDRAVQICDAHKREDIRTLPIRWFFDGDYAAPCEKVMREWNASDTARREREAEQKEVDDKAFLNSFAAQLP